MFFRILTLVITLFVLLLTPSIAFAQISISTISANPSTSSGLSLRAEGLTPIPSYIPPTSPIYTDMLLHNMFHTFSCLAAGQSAIGQPCLTYEVTKNAQGLTQSIPVLSSVDTSGGFLGTTTSVIASLYESRPLKTSDYLASLGQDLGIVKITNAQVVGSGAEVLTPILKLWRVSRNISYLIMIIIFIVIGLMIIFRNKINPQTVITAQASLPGLVIGLILITFSYFLAALLADTAFIGTNIVGAYFSAAQSPIPGTPAGSINLSEKLKDGNVLSIMSSFIGTADIGGLKAAVDSIFDSLGKSSSPISPYRIIQIAAALLSFQYTYGQFGEVPAVIGGTVYCTVSGAASLFSGGFLTGALGTTMSNIPNCLTKTREYVKIGLAITAAGAAYASPGSVISIALYVIIIAILLYTMFKLLMRLVTCFLTIILYTIFAPFQFMVASLPGRQGIATGWILSMLGNILAFPAVIAVFYFVNFLLGSGATSAPLPVTDPALNLTSSGSLPLLAKLNSDFLRLILAFGALIATPTIPDIVARAVGKASQAGQMIGGEIGGGFRSGQGYVKQAGQDSAGLSGLYDKKSYTITGYKDGRPVYEVNPFSSSAGGLSKFGANIRGGIKKVWNPSGDTH